MKKKTRQPNQMQRSRAARCMIMQTPGSNEGMEMAAFMAIFHPDYDERKVRELVRDAADRKRRHT